MGGLGLVRALGDEGGSRGDAEARRSLKGVRAKAQRRKGVALAVAPLFGSIPSFWFRRSDFERPVAGRYPFASLRLCANNYFSPAAHGAL